MFLSIQVNNKSKSKIKQDEEAPAEGEEAPAEEGAEGEAPAEGAGGADPKASLGIHHGEAPAPDVYNFDHKNEKYAENHDQIKKSGWAT